MGNLWFCPKKGGFRLKKCFNLYLRKKSYNVTEFNNDELIQRICAKTSLTKEEIEEWHQSFLVSEIFFLLFD